MANQKPTTDHQVQENAWHIGSRTLLPPAGASDVLRDSIANTPQPDVEAIRQITPRNQEEWLAIIKQTDDSKVEMYDLSAPPGHPSQRTV